MATRINVYSNPEVNPPLNNAVPEAEVVASLLNTRLLRGATATKQAIQQETAGTATLHLSCHGYFA